MPGKLSRFLLLLYIIITFSSVSAYAAITVDVNFTNADLQSALGDTGVVADTIYDRISQYSDVPELARGFGNANTYASHASTLRGYQGYDLFAISVGTMASVQAPSDDPQFYEDLMDEIDKGDVHAGVGVTPVVVQVGMNLGFILDGLYVSFMFGKLHTNIDQGDIRIDHNANLVGGHINYAVFGERSILARSLLWRGLTLQTGFIHTDNKVEFYNELDQINATATVTSYSVLCEIDPSVNFELTTKGNVIPVELYTSIRLLWFLNIGVGGGFDYVVSSRTDFGLSSAGDVVITDDGASGASGYVGETGTVTISGETNGVKSDKYRPKIMANIGFGIGPLFIDFPMSYYLDNGYALGITAGFVW